MKYVVTPAPIRITHPESGMPGTNPDGSPALVVFRTHAIRFWLNDPRWHKNLGYLVKVRPEFDKVGGVLRFEDADFAPLREIVAAPNTQQEGYPLPLYAIQLQPFADAVLNATDAEPIVAPSASVSPSTSPTN